MLEIIKWILTGIGIITIIVGIGYGILGGNIIIWIVGTIVVIGLIILFGWLFLKWITTDDEGEEIR